jgi:hypothetical protein
MSLVGGTFYSGDESTFSIGADTGKKANLLTALCYGDVSMLPWLAEQYRLSCVKKD